MSTRDEKLIAASLTVAASEWDPDTALPRGHMIRLGTRHVVETLTRHGYLSERAQPDSWEGDTAVWSIADARTTVLLHGASTVGRVIELDCADSAATLTDDQALRVADALRAAATWPNLQAAHDALVADLGASLNLDAGLRDIVGSDPENES